MAVSTVRGVAALETTQLLRTTGILHLCASGSLVAAGSSLLRTAIAAPAPLGLPLLAAARSTIFRQFAAGEEMSDVRDVANRLEASGVKCIVDHSTEESEEPSARRYNLESKVSLLHTLRRELRSGCAFVPVKLTALVSPALLEQTTLAAAAVAAEDGGTEPSCTGSANPAAALEKTASALAAAERDELATAMAALRELCEGAREAGIPLLLDAEQTPRQPGSSLPSRLPSRPTVSVVCSTRSHSIPLDPTRSHSIPLCLSHPFDRSLSLCGVQC